MSRRGKGGTPISLFSFQDIITSVTGILILVTLFLGLEVIRRKEGSPEHQTAAITKELRQATEQTAGVHEKVAINQRQIEELRRKLEEEGGQFREEMKHDAERIKRQLRDLEDVNKMLSGELAQSGTQRRAAEQSRTELQSRDQSRQRDRQTLDQLVQEAQEKKQELDKLRQANRVIFNPGAGDGKSPWLVELTPLGVLAARAGKREAPQKFSSVDDFLSWAARRDRVREYFVLLVKPQTIDAFKQARAALENKRFDLGYDLLSRDQTAIDSVSGAAAP